MFDMRNGSSPKGWRVDFHPTSLVLSSRRSCATSVDLPVSSSFQRHPQEPRVLLVQSDRGGKQVDGVGVPVLVGRRARLAQTGEEDVEALGEEADVVEVARGVLRVVGEA